jgi:hypothetical protein
MEGLSYPHNNIGQALNEAGKIIAESIGIKKLIKNIQPIINNIAVKTKEAFDKIPRSLINLTEIGWYVSLNMTAGEINGLAEFVRENNSKSVDKYLMNHFKENYISIKKELINTYSERRKVLNSAFNAHERKDYYASIPLFLSQADGICFNITGHELFRRKNKKPITAEMIKEFKEGTFAYIFLQPLTIQGLIRESIDERVDIKGSINRHSILHGLNLDYGNEINSYKAISLINYVSEILILVQKDKNK